MSDSNDLFCSTIPWSYQWHTLTLACNICCYSVSCSVLTVECKLPINIDAVNVRIQHEGSMMAWLQWQNGKHKKLWVLCDPYCLPCLDHTKWTWWKLGIIMIMSDSSHLLFKHPLMPRLPSPYSGTSTWWKWGINIIMLKSDNLFHWTVPWSYQWHTLTVVCNICCGWGGSILYVSFLVLTVASQL